MSIHFVWDARKAGTNARKHRVSFEEATTAFADRLGCIFDDRERVGSVHIISARVTSPRERHAYQESH